MKRLVVVCAILSACSGQGDAPAPPVAKVEAPASPVAAPVQPSGINWQKGDVDVAFAHAKDAGKPVFLYWGATWCPPCNQVKAMLFTREDFIARSRAFVAVYIDGDSPGAQKLGTRFHVSGYPTMILFSADGRELMRLPGEVEPDEYLRVLSLGMNAGRPVRDTLDRALSGQALGDDDWRMLAFYSWDTDDEQLIAPDKLADTLAQLEHNCPRQLPDLTIRFAFKAAQAAATAKTAPRSAFDKAGTARALLTWLEDAQIVRANADLVTNGASQTVSYLAPAGAATRRELTQAWDGALERLANDTSLWTGDRIDAVAQRVELARLATPKDVLPAPLIEEVRNAAARADHDVSDAYERQAVIPDVADLLAKTGLLDESDHLLNSELSRSHASYYLMLQLAANAHSRGDNETALDWYERAWKAAEGPATRIQWGAIYVRNLIELAPHNEKRIEGAAAQVIDELASSSGGFYERNRASVRRMGARLGQWNAAHQHDAVLGRLRLHMVEFCQAQTEDSERAACDKLLAAPRLRHA